MDKKQYNNIIDWTQKTQPETQTEDSLTAVRAVCNNMGVALPQGDLPQVAETLATDDYMGWQACTQEEAQEAANNGIPAIGVNEDGIILLAADDEEQPVAATAAVMTLARTNIEKNNMTYYTYSCGTTAFNDAEDRLNLFVEWAKNAEGKNLAQCCEYFAVDNPGVAWCAWFVRQCARKAGLYFGNSNMATGLKGLLGNVDYSIQNKPKVGDLAFIINSGETTIGHIGIVVSIEDGEISTMEGNMSGSINTSTVRSGKYKYATGKGGSWGTIAKIGRNS